jgi:hypothetical protein
MIDTPPVLERRPRDPPVDIRKAIRSAVADSKKSMFGLIADSFRAARGPGRLTQREYFYYGLYDDKRLTPEAKRAFVGSKRQNRIIWSCCDRSWTAPAHDKILFYMIMSGAGFAVPPTLAVYHPMRTLPGAAALRDRDSLASFLRLAPVPYFGKPVTGMYSDGAIRISGYRADDDTLLTDGGRALKTADVAAAIDEFRDDGYLIQAVLHPHESIGAVCGDRLATVRVILFLTSEGSKIYRTVWKIPGGDSIADNFWRTGNMLADVDPDSGRVRRIVTGTGAERTELSRHPMSDADLIGLTLPDWIELKALSLSAAHIFPGVRLQAWDVALTDNGPLLMELNIGGDFNLPQLASGTGILDDEFCAFLASCGVKTIR